MGCYRTCYTACLTSGQGKQGMNEQSFGSFGQVAYLVEDFDESVANWAR